jgi:hypothetical protein
VAKPVNVYSKMEMIEIMLEERADQNLLEEINRAFPKGVHFYYFKEMKSEKMSIISRVNRLDMVFLLEADEKMKNKAEEFLSKEEYRVVRKNNEKVNEINIRRFIDSIEFEKNLIRVKIIFQSDGGIKFDELCSHVLGIDDLADIKIYREKFLVKEQGKDYEVFDL